MQDKSIISELKNTQLAVELISLGARIQMLEGETQLSRNKLLKLYKEIQGSSPPKGLLPFSSTWFMTWEPNIHSSIFYNAYVFLTKKEKNFNVEAIIKAYKLYLEQCPPAAGQEPILGLTRAWTLIRFVNSGVMQQSRCRCCKGLFITHAYQPHNSFICSLCQPPSRVEKKVKAPHKQTVRIAGFGDAHNTVFDHAS